MKRTSIQYIRVLLLPLLATTALLSGCVKQELETRPAPRESAVQIAFSWPEGLERPAGAHLWFYAGDGTLYREHDGLTDGYTGTLPAGTYRLILHNTDATDVGYTGMEHYATAETYTLNLAGEAPLDGDLLAGPRKVYGIGQHNEGETFTVRAGEVTSLTVSPAALTKEVTFYFLVNGLERIDGFTGVLHGVASSVSLCTGLCGTTPFSQPFLPEEYVPARRGRVSGSRAPDAAVHHYKTAMTLFDLLTTTDSPAGTNTMVVEITGGDGTVYPLRVDITDVLRQIINDNGGILPIEIPVEVEVEVDPVTAEISATVRPWDESGTGGGEFD